MPLTAADLEQIEQLMRRVLAEHLDAIEDCSFCGRHRAEVRLLVSGSRAGVFICDACTVIAMGSAYSSPQIRDEVHPLLADLTDRSFIRSRDVGARGGLVYAVATVPDLDIRRIKVGYTTRPIEYRLDAFRTANPTASLLGLWAAPAEGEGVAHGLVDGRIHHAEVFHVQDVVAALAAIDEEMSKRWP